MLLKEAKRDGLLLDRVLKHLFFALRMLCLFSLDLHENASLPRRAYLRLLVHHVGNWSTSAIWGTVHVVPEELAAGHGALSNELLQTEVHRSDNLIDDCVFVIQLQEQAI